ncbi:GDSL-type esterase/lipase family protein [Patulibacter sp. NPDC049589]|uniref:GDSL-type esterase/lipase family protein n=1 Tax=Patulibacter sp. NPDC049589 TaxID=3154731 RepID=UPI003431C29D
MNSTSAARRPDRAGPVGHGARSAAPHRPAAAGLVASAGAAGAALLLALPATAPAAPRGVFAQPVNTPHAVRLTWERPSGGGVTATRIEGRDLGARSRRWRAVRTVRANTARITGLKAGHRYRFRIRFRTTGRSFGAPGPSVIVRALGRVPSVVTGLEASPAGTAAGLAWAAAPGATRYRVERVDVLSGTVERLDAPSSARTLTDTPPARLAGRWLRYRVIAMDGGAEAAPSAPVEVRAPGFPGYTAYYALGDSYAAGTGLGQPYDDQPCRRNGRMWAALLPRDLVPVPQFIACSGATTTNVRLSSDGGVAQVPDIGGTQLDRVLGGLRATPGPALITLSIGGNDARFVPQFTRCVTGDCTGDAATETALIRGTVRRSLDATFAQIRRIAPGADVLVAGYPRLFSEGALPVDAVFALTLTQAERRLANVWATQVDEEVAASARANGLHPVTDEVLQSFAGHGAGSAAPWINTVQVADAGTPIGLAPDVPATSSIHPNASGNQAYADVMTQALRAYAAHVQVR